MKAKEYAINMVNDYGNIIGSYINDLVLDIAKRCALKAVNEIMLINLLYTPFEEAIQDCSPQQTQSFWEEVKKEIIDYKL